jgi:type IV pilus biogenesis protein PilP
MAIPSTPAMAMNLPTAQGASTPAPKPAAAVTAIAPQSPILAKELADADKTANEVARLTQLIKLIEAEKTYEEKKGDLEKTRALVAANRLVGKPGAVGSATAPAAETPLVVSIEGVGNNLRARLSYASGGFISVKAGDRLPSGQTVMTIAPSRVAIRDNAGAALVLPMALSQNTGSPGGSVGASLQGAAPEAVAQQGQPVQPVTSPAVQSRSPIPYTGQPFVQSPGTRVR